MPQIAAAAARRKPGPANRDRTIKALGREASRRKVEKRFDIDVHDAGMEWERNRDRIEAEATLDGVCVVRTSLESASMGVAEAVEDCKSLAGVERVFLTMRTSRLRIRPVHVHSEDHVRAHVFLCMLACHVEWHMRRLAPILFEDDDREGGRPDAAQLAGGAREGLGKRTPDGLRPTASRRFFPTSAR